MILNGGKIIQMVAMINISKNNIAVSLLVELDLVQNLRLQKAWTWVIPHSSLHYICESALLVVYQ